MVLEIKEFYYALCKGRICSYVARGNDKPERILKSIRTIMAKGRIDQEAIQGMLVEVDLLSVRPFLGPPWNQPERLGRFQAFKGTLERAFLHVAA